MNAHNALLSDDTSQKHILCKSSFAYNYDLIVAGGEGGLVQRDVIM